MDVLTVYCSDSRDAMELRTSEASLRIRVAELERSLQGHELRARLTALEEKERQARGRCVCVCDSGQKSVCGCVFKCLLNSLHVCALMIAQQFGRPGQVPLY